MHPLALDPKLTRNLAAHVLIGFVIVGLYLYPLLPGIIAAPEITIGKDPMHFFSELSVLLVFLYRGKILSHLSNQSCEGHQTESQITDMQYGSILDAQELEFTSSHNPQPTKYDNHLPYSWVHKVCSPPIPHSCCQGALTRLDTC